MPLEDYHVDSFIEYLVTVRGASKHTVSAYKRALDDFDRYAPSVIATKLEDILQFLIDLKDIGMSEATQAQKLTALRTFFKFMLDFCPNGFCLSSYIFTKPFKAISNFSS